MAASSIQAKATKTSLSVGRATNWYLHANVDACMTEQYGPGPWTDRQKMWCKAWFAEVGFHDPYADFRSNDWVGSIVAGPFPTKEEAMTAAAEHIAKESDAEKEGSVA